MSFNSHFQPIQHGVAVKGGTELLIHHVSLLLESNPDWVLLKTDIKNAFNSLERTSLMPQIAKSFPDVYQHVFQMYSRCNPLIFCHGEQPHVLSSQEGVHQRDPLGPMLFSAAIHPLLVDLQESHPKTRVLAYLDDVFLLGPIQYVSSAFDKLKCSLPQIGLSIATKKCELFTNGRHCEDEVRVSVLGTTILGTPIGQPRYVEAACSKFAKGGEDLCNQLLALEDTQSSMLLLRYCHIPRINHLGRTVALSLMKSAARIHDSLSQSSFKHLITCPDLENNQWTQATLPIRHGGFGMSLTESLSSIAFVSSWAHSLVQLPKSFKDIQDSVDLLVENRQDATPGSTGFELEQSLPHSKSLEDILSNKKGLQKKLSQNHFNTITSELLGNTNSL